MNIENKEKITFSEFQAWLTGLIRGKNGAIPDLDDWRMIKTMMDRVQPDEVTITVPVPTEPLRENYPFPRTAPRQWPNTTKPYEYSPPTIWCSDRTQVQTSLGDNSLPIAASSTYNVNASDDLGNAIENMIKSN